MNTKKWLSFGAVIVATLALGACSTTKGLSPDGLSARGASKAPAPVVIQDEAALTGSLACFGNYLPGVVFGVMPTSDNTGKVDMTDGGTGRLLPENAAPFLISALYDGNLNPQDLSPKNFDTMERVAKFGGNGVVQALQAGMSKNAPEYLVDGSFDTLDFTGGTKFDVRIGGIGPILESQGIAVTTSVRIIDAYSRLVVGKSELRSFVSYESLGLGVSATPKGVLTTGAAYVDNQQQLQFEAARKALKVNLVLAISAMTEKKNFQGPVEQCRGMTKAVLTSI